MNQWLEVVKSMLKRGKRGQQTLPPCTTHCSPPQQICCVWQALRQCRHCAHCTLLVNTFLDTQISRTFKDFKYEIQGLSRTCGNPETEAELKCHRSAPVLPPVDCHPAGISLTMHQICLIMWKHDIIPKRKHTTYFHRLWSYDLMAV